MNAGSSTAARYRRSPHLLARWEADRMVLIDCRTLRRFGVDEALLALLRRLDRWSTAAELAAGGGTPTGVRLDELAEMGIVERTTLATADGRAASSWDPIDIAAHRASNRGGYREADLAGTGPPPSAFKPRPSGAVTALGPAGDLPQGLGETLRRRRSVRRYGPEPLPVAALSTVLHHSARIVGVYEDETLGEQALRPYAAGGARSELEIYAIANDVDGLAPGAHYYDARRHELIAVAGRNEHQDGLNRWVRAATAGRLSRDPPALLVITAVFARILWKYRGIGLAVIYKNTGCLLENFYLTATALGLSPCAVATADEPTVSRWLELDPLVESPVACFLLGPRPPASSRAGS